MRAAVHEHQRLVRGTALLATISATAPLLGVLLTARMIIGSFKGCGCEKSQMLAMLTGGFAEAFLPTAVGLATAIVAWSLREHFRSAVAEFDIEMRAATLDLMNELRRTSP